MSSKRGLRRRQQGRECGRKHAHPTQTQAVAHLIRLKQCGEINVRSYFCNFCGAWHVGHYR